MAIRPFAPGAALHGSASSRSSASEPRAARGGERSARHEVAPFGGAALAPFGDGGLFGGGRDPFAEFGRMDPFGGPGGGFGSLMKQFDEMTKGMGMGMGGFQGGGLGGGGTMGMGNGQYSCQSFAMCSRMGPDGNMHTERFANSEVGNRAHGIREAQQAYSNSSLGVDKMGLERQMGDRGRKVVRERNRHTMEERSTEMFKGMDESGRDHFDRSFGDKAHHLPQHSRFDAQALAAGAFGGGGGRQMAAIGGPSGHAPQRHRSVPSGHRR
mmetsp:Transcript_137696/g.357707  ORF Transcript_137696/g.357707 Transcript_137696/m.357707 type:complete len:269 (+) Transcript_137696:105-911(+)